MSVEFEIKGERENFVEIDYRGEADYSDNGVCDPEAIYIRDIGQFPLLTAVEEVELARKIEDGKLAKHLLERGLFEKEGEEELRERILRADGARRRFIEANLRLVVFFARKYLGKGLPLLDLIQEGNIGLSRAVDKFDYEKGNRFCTYAVWWIKQGIKRGIESQSRTIKLPGHVFTKVNKLMQFTADFLAENGYRPNDEELSRRFGLELNFIRFLHGLSHVTRSLDQTVSDGDVDGLERETLGDFIEDPAASEMFSLIEGDDFRKSVKQILLILTTREREVIIARYGLAGGEYKNLGDVAVLFGISSERVRQIEAGAIEKLKTSTFVNHFFANG